MKRLFVCGIFFLFVVFALYTYLFKYPSNSKNWEYGFEILPHFTINNSRVAIENARDTEYVQGTEFRKHYFNQGYDAHHIEKVWFVVSKFSGFGGVAHTYFIFDMSDTQPITVSVEARREKGEDYSLSGGLFNKFELMYVWASERDSLIRRSVISKDKVYMYPLNLSQLSKENLFLQLARRSQSLETTPRFYNTLLSNCTNELAKTANDIKPGTIPMNIALFLPGYAAKELHKLGYIAGAGAIEEIEQRHYITEFVQNHAQDPELSAHLRDYLK